MPQTLRVLTAETLMLARMLLDLVRRQRSREGEPNTGRAPDSSSGEQGAAVAAMHAAEGAERQKSGDTASAIACYRRALEIDATLWPVWCNLGVALQSSGDLNAAEQALARCVRLAPDSGEGRLNLGLVLHERGDAARAEQELRTAASLLPDLPEVHYNLGNVLWRPGRYPEAIESYRHAIRLRPDYAEAHWNLAHLLLMQGDWVNGFEEFEWRWHLAKLSAYARTYAEPQWRGQPLSGKTVLLWWEQGFGDTLQFMRYATGLAQRGARVLLDVQQPLRTVAATVPGVEAVVCDDTSGRFDYQLPLMSLPLVLGVRPDNIDATAPYVEPPPGVRERWRERLGPAETLRVGLTWSSGIRKEESLFSLGVSRSMPLAFLAPLAGIEGIELHSVQTGEPAAEARRRPYGLNVRDWHTELRDFGETAGLLSQLDLLITVDTAVAHLAGAMGMPVWNLMKPEQCWRWLREREDSPWYPTMRLFRQKTPGDWSGPVEAVARELSAMVAARKTEPSQVSRRKFSR